MPTLHPTLQTPRKAYIAVFDIMEAPKPKVADGKIPLEDPKVARYRRRLRRVIFW
jgi:putative thioredoxin